MAIANKMLIASEPRREMESLELIRTWLGNEAKGSWLVVVDNADEANAFTVPQTGSFGGPNRSPGKDPPRSLTEYFPLCDHGRIIFTTKSRSAALSYAQAGKIIEVGRLTNREALKLLDQNLADKQIISYNMEKTEELIEKLDRLPLALAQATAFMNKNFLSIEQYLNRIADDTALASLMNHPQAVNDIPGVPSAVYGIWKLTYKKLQTNNQLAFSMLASMSFFDQNCIPVTLLQSILGDSVELDKARGELHDYSLITTGALENTYNMHRLVQVTILEYLKECRLETGHCLSVLTALANNFPLANEVRLWGKCRDWLPHALRVLQSPLLGLENLDRANLQVKVGWYYYKVGQWSEARHYTEYALATREKLIADPDMDILKVKENLVHILRYDGDISLAAVKARELKNDLKSKLGRKNNWTLQSYRLLAASLQDDGQYDMAARAALQAYKGFKDLYNVESDNADILSSARRPGTIYELMGQYSETIKLYKEAIDGFMRRNETESQEALLAMHRLSYVQRALGEYSDSEKAAMEGWSTQDRVLGESNPDTLKSLFSIGVAVQCQQNLGEASEVFAEVFEQCVQKVGWHHFYICTICFHIAQVLDELERYEEAKEKHAWVLDGRKRLLRENHPDIMISQAGLARVLMNVGDLVQAEELALKTKKTLEKEGGLTKARQIVAWMCMETLAKVWAKKALQTTDSGEMSKESCQRESIKWMRQLMDGKEKALGWGHIETIKTATQFSDYLADIGDVKAAKKLQAKMPNVFEENE